jgi:predicted dehydrogenase
VRLGLLAAARITDSAVVIPAGKLDDVEVTAVAASTLERARQAADRWGIATAYGSYQELIDDPAIDALYIATPASLHRRWTLAALAAGKHVLCEKPLAANAADARTMVQAGLASGKLLMEAFHWRYHPVVTQLRTLLDDGRLGQLRRVEGRFMLPAGHIPPGDIRWDLALGGGALMDLGCYPAQWLRWAVGAEPRVVSARAECPIDQVDGALHAELAWDHGVTGSIECSMIAEPGPVIVDLVMIGTEATATMSNPLAPQHGAELTVCSGNQVDRIALMGLDTTTYFHQFRAFRDAAATGAAFPTGGADSIATMELIDACYLAAGLEPRPTHPL